MDFKPAMACISYVVATLEFQMSLCDFRAVPFLPFIDLLRLLAFTLHMGQQKSTDLLYQIASELFRFPSEVKIMSVLGCYKKLAIRKKKGCHIAYRNFGFESFNTV